MNKQDQNRLVFKSRQMINDVPFIGAEIFIEPGQTSEEIDRWFLRLKECGMSITRIRLFENYMRAPGGAWDYSLFDTAFQAGEKYGIGIYGNLFPATSFTDVGGFKFPSDSGNLTAIAEYIARVVPHFQQFSSLAGWVPINEPGSGGLPPTVFTREKFEAWKQELDAAEYTSQGYTTFDFHEQKFLLHHNTWFLGWLTAEIRKYDAVRPVHVNNHAIFQHAAEYDFPAWTKFLDSLGCSAHASWHFGYFTRDQYTVGMSAASEIIRSGAGEIPWFMTELQGGNNIYSSFHPLCPAKEEVTQWLWTVIATGGKGAIFWCLNARGSGFEAGEWAMLDFLDDPSDRMLAANEVAGIIRGNDHLFADTTVLESGISILYTRESLWIERALQVPGAVYEGREEGGAMKSALGWFAALTEMGIQANFKEIGEFDFKKPDFTGITIILAHQVCIPSVHWQNISHFVENGGKLIVDGLTGFYDENAHCVMKTGFPMRTVFGAEIREFKLVGNLFTIALADQEIELPAHLWRGSLHLISASPLASFKEEIVACRNRFGKGEVVWIPSLIGLGSRMTGDNTALSLLIRQEIAMTAIPFRFDRMYRGTFMKSIRSGDAFLSVLINKSPETCGITLTVNDKRFSAKLLFANKNGSVKDNFVIINPEETVVIHWIMAPPGQYFTQ